MNDLEILNHHQLSNPTPVSLHFKTSETGAEEGRGGWGKVRKEKDLRRGSLFPSLPNPLPFSFLPSSLCPFDASHSGYFKIKRTKAHTTFQRPKRPDLSRFPQHGGVLLLPPGWDSSPSHTHLNNWVKRGKVEWYLCLRKQRDGRGLNPRPPDPEFEVLTARRATHAFIYTLPLLSLTTHNYMSNILYMR